mgnify:CR=1 FL=1
MAKQAALAVLAALAGAAPAAHADWSGRGELGIVLSRGNSDSTSLNAEFDVAHAARRWRHDASASALRATYFGRTSANRLELQAQSRYELTPRAFAFAALRHEDDRYSEFEYQTTVSAGPGYVFLDDATTAIVAQAGVGWRRAEVRTTGFRESDPVVRADLYLEYHATPYTRLRNEFLVESGADNTYVQNELSLEVAMSERLALGVSHTVRHNDAVSPGVRRTDQLTTANLVLRFD